jgi:hypothetical protein
MLLNRNCPSSENTNGTLKFTVGGLVCPQTKIGYIPYVTSYNNPKMSQRMLYSQYVNTGRKNSNILFSNVLAYKNGETNGNNNNNNNNYINNESIFNYGNYNYSKCVGATAIKK